MKKNNIALIIFAVPTLAILFFEFANLQINCKSLKCMMDYDSIFFWWFLLFSICILIILLLKKLPTTTTVAWWKFAYWAIPIVLVISALINSGIHHSPNGQLQNIFDMPALILLYSIFTIGSIVQIIRGYRNMGRI